MLTLFLYYLSERFCTYYFKIGCVHLKDMVCLFCDMRHTCLLWKTLSIQFQIYKRNWLGGNYFLTGLIIFTEKEMPVGLKIPLWMCIK